MNYSTDVLVLDSNVPVMKRPGFKRMHLDLDTTSLKHASDFPEVLIAGTQPVEEEISQALWQRTVEVLNCFQMNPQPPVELFVFVA